LVAFCIVSGGAAEVVHFRGNVEGVVLRLGYSMYFLTIIEIWKILGGVVILLIYPAPVRSALFCRGCALQRMRFGHCGLHTAK
jgi:hypothetical protein